MMVGGTLKISMRLYSSRVKGHLLLQSKIPLVIEQEILLLTLGLRNLTAFYATAFPIPGSRLDDREGYSHLWQLGDVLL